MRLAAAIGADIRFQYRQGFYAAYLIVAVLYVVIIRALPEAIQEQAAVLLIFTDTSVLGSFFIGGVMLLEKAQRIHDALFVTPLRVWEYVAAKLVSLTLLAFAASMLVALGGVGPRMASPLLIAGVIGGSALFTLAGMIIGSRAASVNQYLLMTPLVALPVIPSTLVFFGVLRSPAWIVLPTQPPLMYIGAAATGISTPALIGSAICCAVWCGVLWIWANRWIHAHVVRTLGGGA